jgi:hypothetical protein
MTSIDTYTIDMEILVYLLLIKHFFISINIIFKTIQYLKVTNFLWPYAGNYYLTKTACFVSKGKNIFRNKMVNGYHTRAKKSSVLILANSLPNVCRARIFSCVGPFYERAVSDLDP